MTWRWLAGRNFGQSHPTRAISPSLVVHILSSSHTQAHRPCSLFPSWSPHTSPTPCSSPWLAETRQHPPRLQRCLPPLARTQRLAAHMFTAVARRNNSRPPCSFPNAVCSPLFAGCNSDTCRLQFPSRRVAARRHRSPLDAALPAWAAARSPPVVAPPVPVAAPGPVPVAAPGHAVEASFLTGSSILRCWLQLSTLLIPASPHRRS